MSIVIISLLAEGLGRGDPISPLFFNLVADVFTKCLMKAARNGQITRLLHGFEHSGVISMQYADDTLLFLQNDLNQCMNLK